MRKNIDLLTSLAFLALGIGMFLSANSMEAVIAYDVGPGFFPKIVGLGFIILSIFKIINTIKLKEYKKKNLQFSIGKGVLTVLIFGLYVLGFKTIGFLISSIVYLFVEISLLKWDGKDFKKGLKSTIIISVLVPVVVYFFFAMVLDLVLPAGILG